MPEEKQALAINEIWNNFEPGRVLNPDSPFRISRDITDLRKPQRALARASNYEKWFLIGHRGCGKSTFLKHLLSINDVQENYYPINYRISDVTDRNDVTHEDVLFSIASQLVDLAQEKKAIKDKLHKRLDTWGRTLVETVNKEEGYNVEVEGGLSAYFAKFMAKLRVQTTTRKEFRKTVEPQLSDLINIIDELSEAIEQKIKKPLLIAIDDIDKLRLDKAIDLFENHFDSLTKPLCHIIYTVPVAILHKPAYQNLQGKAWYIPNVKLYSKNNRNERNQEGYDLMKSFIEKRVQLALIHPKALDLIITYGGGVFRQTCSIMQFAVDRVEDSTKLSIGEQEAKQARSEFANGLVPQLSTNDLNNLKKISLDNSIQLAFETPELLHNGSVLRYPNENHWHDVNPVLWERVNNHEIKDQN